MDLGSLGYLFEEEFYPPRLFVPISSVPRDAKDVPGTWFELSTVAIERQGKKWRVRVSPLPRDDTSSPSILVHKEMMERPLRKIEESGEETFVLVDEVKYTEGFRVIAVALCGESTWWLGKVKESQKERVDGAMSGVYLWPDTEGKVRSRVKGKGRTFVERKGTEQFKAEAIFESNVAFTRVGAGAVYLEPEVIHSLDNSFRYNVIAKEKPQEVAEKRNLKEHEKRELAQTKEEDHPSKKAKAVTHNKISDPPFSRQCNGAVLSTVTTMEITVLSDPRGEVLMIPDESKSAVDVNGLEQYTGYRVLPVTIPGASLQRYIVCGDYCSADETWTPLLAQVQLRQGHVVGSPLLGMYLTITDPLKTSSPSLSTRVRPTRRPDEAEAAKVRPKYTLQRQSFHPEIWTSIDVANAEPRSTPSQPSDYRLLQVASDTRGTMCWWTVPSEVYKCMLCNGREGDIMCCRCCLIYAHCSGSAACAGMKFTNDRLCHSCAYPNPAAPETSVHDVDDGDFVGEDPVMECFLIAYMASRMKGISDRGTPTMENGRFTPLGRTTPLLEAPPLQLAKPTAAAPQQIEVPSTHQIMPKEEGVVEDDCIMPDIELPVRPPSTIPAPYPVLRPPARVPSPVCDSDPPVPSMILEGKPKPLRLTIPTPLSARTPRPSFLAGEAEEPPPPPLTATSVGGLSPRHSPLELNNPAVSSTSTKLRLSFTRKV